MPVYGFQGQVGWSEEVTFGTFVAPTRFSEYLSESMQANEDRYLSPGIRGTRSRFKPQTAQGVKRPGGAIVFDSWAKGLGLLFKHTVGAVTTTTPDAVNAPTVRLHTFNIADALPVGLSLEVDKQTQVHRFLGSRVNRLTIEARVGEPAKITPDFLSRDESLVATPTAATFPTGNELLVFHQGVMLIAAVQVDVYDFRVVIENFLREDDFRSGSRLRQSLDARDRLVSGSFRIPYDAVTQYNNFRNLTAASLNLKFTGSIIQATLPFFLEINLPSVFYTGETPTTPGKEDEIVQPLAFEAHRDASDEVDLKYQNNETAP